LSSKGPWQYDELCVGIAVRLSRILSLWADLFDVWNAVKIFVPAKIAVIIAPETAQKIRPKHLPILRGRISATGFL